MPLAIPVMVCHAAPAQCWQYIAFGLRHSAAIADDGTLCTWGFNYFGQLGLGNNTWNYISPQAIPLGAGTAEISLGYYRTGTLRTDGSLWVWGNYSDGALGLGDNDNHNVPMPVSCGITAAVEEHTAPGLVAYPNPTNGPLLLDRMVDEGCLRDLHGRMVLTFRNASRLDLEALPAGTYVLEARVDGRVAHVRVVREGNIARTSGTGCAHC